MSVVSRLLTTDYWLLATGYWLLTTDLAGRCTLGFALASFSSFLRLVSVFATFPARQIVSL